MARELSIRVDPIGVVVGTEPQPKPDGRLWAELEVSMLDVGVTFRAVELLGAVLKETAGSV